MTPYKGKGKGALHKAGAEGFAAPVNSLLRDLVKSFEGTMVVNQLKSSFGEKVSDRCVALGEIIKTNNIQPLPLSEIIGELWVRPWIFLDEGRNPTFLTSDRPEKRPDP